MTELTSEPLQTLSPSITAPLHLTQCVFTPSVVHITLFKHQPENDMPKTQWLLFLNPFDYVALI